MLSFLHLFIHSFIHSFPYFIFIAKLVVKLWQSVINRFVPKIRTFLTVVNWNFGHSIPVVETPTKHLGYGSVQTDEFRTFRKSSMIVKFIGAIVSRCLLPKISMFILKSMQVKFRKPLTIYDWNQLTINDVTCFQEYSFKLFETTVLQHATMNDTGKPYEPYDDYLFHSSSVNWKSYLRLSSRMLPVSKQVRLHLQCSTTYATRAIKIGCDIMLYILVLNTYSWITFIT